MFDDLPDKVSGRLVDDAYVAKRISMSPGWVRKQRFNRRHGLPHVLTIDPVMIASVPRYWLEDVRAWIKALEPEKTANHSGVEDSEDKETPPGLERTDELITMCGLTVEQTNELRESVGLPPLAPDDSMFHRPEDVRRYYESSRGGPD